jgi:hypothetical protein
MFAQAGGEEYITFYLVTECALRLRDDSNAVAWYPFIRQKLVQIQNADGSWSGHHCITSRTFCTAAALLTLQSADQYLATSDF